MIIYIFSEIVKLFMCSLHIFLESTFKDLSEYVYQFKLTFTLLCLNDNKLKEEGLLKELFTISSDNSTSQIYVTYIF